MRPKQIRTGEYELSAVPPGIYELRSDMQGFQPYQLAALPVLADRITQANIVLNVGAVSETVEVSASVAQLQTQSAALAAERQPISTPHVREYFPENAVLDTRTDHIVKMVWHRFR